MRSLWPCGDSSATPSFPSQLEWKIRLPRANTRGAGGSGGASLGSRRQLVGGRRGKQVPYRLPILKGYPKVGKEGGGWRLVEATLLPSRRWGRCLQPVFRVSKTSLCNTAHFQRTQSNELTRQHYLDTSGLPGPSSAALTLFKPLSVAEGVTI